MTQTLTNDPAVSPTATTSPTLAGLTVPRRYTRPGVNPLDEVTWDKRRTVITNPDGSVVFQMDDVEVPADWSQLATDIVVSKYFRKAGVPGSAGPRDQRAPGGAPARPHDPRDGRGAGRLLRQPRGRRRLRGRARLHAGAPDRRLQFAGVVQLRPVPRVRHRRLGRQLRLGPRRPARCSVDHGLLLAPPGLGLLHPVGRRRPDVDLRAARKNEARVFKFGSGTGTNFSQAARPHGEALGRRHVVGPDVASSRCSTAAPAPPSRAAPRGAPPRWWCSTWTTPRSSTSSAGRCARRRRSRRWSPPATRRDFNGEAYATVSGQNSNNSVRVPDEFMDAVDRTTARGRPRSAPPARCTRPTRRATCGSEIAEAAWQLRRSRRAVRRHHPALAHLQGHGSDQRDESVRDRRHAGRDRRRLAADRLAGRQDGAGHRRRRPAPLGHADLPDRPEAGLPAAHPRRLRGAHHRRPQGVDDRARRRAGQGARSRR